MFMPKNRSCLFIMWRVNTGVSFTDIGGKNIIYFYILFGPCRSIKKIFTIRIISLCRIGKTDQVLKERRRNEFWLGNGNDFLPLSMSSGTSIKLTQIKGMMKRFRHLQFSVALFTFCTQRWLSGTVFETRDSGMAEPNELGHRSILNRPSRAKAIFWWD